MPVKTISLVAEALALPRGSNEMQQVSLPRPLRGRILVRQDRPVERLASGLYVPDIAARELQQDFAEVLALGPEVEGEPYDVKVGDRVLFTRRPGTALVYDPRDADPNGWKDLLMLFETDIVGVVED